jgi:hypothetical protein
MSSSSGAGGIIAGTISAGMAPAGIGAAMVFGAALAGAEAMAGITGVTAMDFAAVFMAVVIFTAGAASMAADTEVLTVAAVTAVATIDPQSVR